MRYGEKFNTPDSVASWKKPLRKVTLNLLKSDGKTESEVLSVPNDWEIDVEEYYMMGTAYLDKECKTPYKYPGNGSDYSVWIKDGAN